MPDGKPDATVPGGNEPDTEPEETPNTSNEPTALEEADRINKEKDTLLDREEKITERREKLAAAEAVGGRAKVGTQETKKETNEEYANKLLKGEVSPLEDDGINL